MDIPRAGVGRITAAAVAIAAMLPYLTLKALWLTGSSVGVTDPTVMTSSVMVGGNAVTMGMEVVALVLVLAFTMRWGARLPAWLLLPPLWVGTGLLGVVAVTVPLSLLLEGASVFDTGGPIEPWVYLVVYGGFIGQAAGLVAAFVLHARDRWPAVFTTAVGHPYPSPTRSFQRVAARGALAVATVLGGTCLFLALGGGMPTVAALRTALEGVLAIAGGIALVTLVRARGRRPFRQPLAVAWLGSGSLFAGGLYAMLATLATGPLDPGLSGVLDFVKLFGMLTGLVMGMTGAFLLAERSAVGHVQPVQQPLEPEDRDGDRQAAHQGHR